VTPDEMERIQHIDAMETLAETMAVTKGFGYFSNDQRFV
jgi:hypothetical protein